MFFEAFSFGEVVIKMKALLVLTALFVGCCVSAPLSQLFEPFDAFLQGEVLKTGDAFYSADEFSSLSKLFAVSY